MAHTRLFRKIKQSIQKAKILEGRQGPLQDRRTFLKKAAVSATALVPAVQLLRQGIAWGGRATINGQKPVFILGAGAAGLAAAYTLKKAGTPFVLTEASHRVGGRIFTMQNFNGDGQFIERGAELVDTSHLALRGLAKELGVTIENFDDSKVEKELFFFNGQLYTDVDFIKGVKPLITALDKAKKEINVSSDIGITYKDRGNPQAVKYDHMNMREFLDIHCPGVERWVRDAIEVAYLGEYGREIQEQSAYNLISLLAEVDLAQSFEMFGGSDEVARVQGGNSQLIYKIYEALGPDQEKSVFFNTKVTALRNNGDEVTCTFANGHEISSDRVICTIPFTVLREVNLQGLAISQVKRRCIEELGYGTGGKVCLGFKNRFWRQPTERARGSIIPASVIPASSGLIYGDFESQEFWETS